MNKRPTGATISLLRGRIEIAREIREKLRKKEKGTGDMSKMILPDESYRIMGACFEVYKRMGCGFLEHVYQECL